MNTSNQYKILGASAIIGLLVGVAFIYVQPLFGMSALTGRHAQGYMNLGSLNEGAALSIAWTIHLLISMLYGIATGAALLISNKAITFIMQVLALGWVTTLIAPPANAFIVKLIGLGAMPSLLSLPPLNFSIDAKFLLHVIFFAVIASALLAYSKSSKNLSSRIERELIVRTGKSESF